MTTRRRPKSATPEPRPLTPPSQPRTGYRPARPQAAWTATGAGGIICRCFAGVRESLDLKHLGLRQNGTDLLPENRDRIALFEAQAVQGLDLRDPPGLVQDSLRTLEDILIFVLSTAEHAGRWEVHLTGIGESVSGQNALESREWTATAVRKTSRSTLVLVWILLQ